MPYGCWNSALLHFLQMRGTSKTLTTRLPEDLAQWLAATSKSTGIPRGQLIRIHLEKARGTEEKPFMRLAGIGSGPRDLSMRKGFSKK
jgi:hypothetical protein